MWPPPELRALDFICEVHNINDLEPIKPPLRLAQHTTRMAICVAIRVHKYIQRNVDENLPAPT